MAVSLFDPELTRDDGMAPTWLQDLPAVRRSELGSEAARGGA